MRVRRRAHIDDIEIIAGEQSVDIGGEFSDPMAGAEIAATLLIKRAKHRDVEEVLRPIVSGKVASRDSSSDNADT